MASVSAFPPVDLEDARAATGAERRDARLLLPQKAGAADAGGMRGSPAVASSAGVPRRACLRRGISAPDRAIRWPSRRSGRVAEGGALLRRYGGELLHRGFESLLLRSRIRDRTREPVAAAATLSVARRGGRAVECGGLENRYGSLGSSRVQIPPSPLERAACRRVGCGSAFGRPERGVKISARNPDGRPMRERLIKHLLDPILPATCPSEEFFSAGPRVTASRPIDRRRRDALLVDLRRQATVRRRARVA